MPRFLARLPVYRFELSAIILLSSVVLTLAIFGLTITGHSIRHTFNATLNVLPVTLLAGVFLHALYHIITQRTIKPYLHKIARVQWLVLWLRLWIACWIVSFGYFWLKVYIPLINSHSWDLTFWEIDGLLHLGHQPNLLLTELLQGTPWATWLDRWYQGWLYTVVFGMAFFAASDNDLLRRRVMHSCMLLWGLGVWVYLAFPAVGPVFIHDAIWNDLASDLPRTVNAQQLLWSNYQNLQQTHAPTEGIFHHTLGVAAMPSLHVAFHALFAFWAKRYMQLLLIPFVLMTLVTLVASVFTGWHYAVDGYIGILLAYLCYRLALWWEKPSITE